MGRIISTWATNTPDTNTSRRQVKTHTHISTTTTTTLHQIQTHHEDYWIDCIYFDASSCCYGFNSFCKVHCISRRNPHSHVCPQKPTKPSHPDNCYSKIWNKEVMHGEMGARKCCWYGDWKKKSKCEKKTSHPYNCYSTIWNTEVMHGEMGAKKCCWKGDWKRKSKCNGGHKDD